MPTQSKQTKYRGVPMEIFEDSVAGKIGAVITIANPSNPNKPYKIAGSAKTNGDKYSQSFGMTVAKQRAFIKMQKLREAKYEKLIKDFITQRQSASGEREIVERKMMTQIKHYYPDYVPTPKETKEARKARLKAKKLAKKLKDS